MPGTVRAGGNANYDWLIQPTLTWASVNANTTAEQSVTILGLQLGDYVDLWLANGAQTTGLAVINIRVSAKDTLTVQWVNSTAGGLTPVSGPYIMNIMRPENPGLLPTSAI